MQYNRGQNNMRRYNIRQGTTRQDKIIIPNTMGHSEIRPDQITQDSSRQYNTIQYNIRHYNARQDGTIQDMAT